MPYNLKLFFCTLLLFTSMSFIGCGRDKKSVPPVDKNTEKQNTQAKNNEQVLLDAPMISQKPELGSGCEVTSLTMLLQYAEVKVDKMTLAKEIKKDETPVVFDKEGNIIKWGNPNKGFVGDITGKDPGFAVYPKPMLELMEKYLPGKSVDLTKESFETLLKSIDQKHPVIVWVTIDFKPAKKYEEWEMDGGNIKATLDEHAVLLVGYDRDNCYINNPINGVKNEKINKDTFIEIWNTMGNMAISYK